MRGRQSQAATAVNMGWTRMKSGPLLLPSRQRAQRSTVQPRTVRPRPMRPPAAASDTGTSTMGTRSMTGSLLWSRLRGRQQRGSGWGSRVVAGSTPGLTERSGEGAATSATSPGASRRARTLRWTTLATPGERGKLSAGAGRAGWEWNARPPHAADQGGPHVAGRRRRGELSFLFVEPPAPSIAPFERLNWPEAVPRGARLASRAPTRFFAPPRASRKSLDIDPRAGAPATRPAGLAPLSPPRGRLARF